MIKYLFRKNVYNYKQQSTNVFKHLLWGQMDKRQSPALISLRFSEGVISIQNSRYGYIVSVSHLCPSLEVFSRLQPVLRSPLKKAL